MSSPEYPSEDFGGRDRWKDDTPLYQVVFENVGAAIGGSIQKIGETIQKLGEKNGSEDNNSVGQDKQ